MTETKRRRLANILPQGAASSEPAIPELITQDATAGNEESLANTAPSAATLDTAFTAQTSKPRFAEFERKEARLRQDQLDALDALARKIKRARKPGAGERITDNTLIRVAVDLLLARQNELAGSTEDELRTSVNL